MNMTTIDLIKFLHLNRPDLVSAMVNADHNYDAHNLSPYHLEGSVMTHLMMVMEAADRQKISPLAKVMALVHDLGKPMSLFADHNKKRNFFIGHEGASCYIMIDLLKQLGLSKREIELCIFVVAHHTYLYRFMDSSGLNSDRLRKMQGHFINNKEAYNLLLELADADNAGRITTDKREDFRPYFELATDLVNKSPDIVFDKANFKYEIQVLIGPQASGKSTYAEKMKAQGFTILSRDAMAEEVFNRPYNDLRREEIFDERVDKLFNVRLNEHIVQKVNLIVDKTNMTNKSQRRVFGQTKQGECYKKAIVFMKDYEILKKHLLKRTELTGKHVFYDNFHETIMNFQAPTYETFHEIEYKIFDDKP